MGNLTINYGNALKLENLLIGVRDEPIREVREKLMNELVPQYKEAVVNASGLYSLKTMRIFLKTFEELHDES